MIAVDGAASRFRSSSTLFASSPPQAAETTCSSRRLRRAHCTYSPATLTASDRSAFAPAPAPKRAARTRPSHPQLDPPVATPSNVDWTANFPASRSIQPQLERATSPEQRPITTKKLLRLYHPFPPSSLARTHGPGLTTTKQIRLGSVPSRRPRLSIIVIPRPTATLSRTLRSHDPS
jgi:hypothetical protein